MKKHHDPISACKKITNGNFSICISTESCTNLLVKKEIITNFGNFFTKNIIFANKIDYAVYIKIT